MESFVKYNGAGNDFIILNNMDGHLTGTDFSTLAAKICRRRLDVGADGLMVTQPSKVADFSMLFYNADGSVGEMCGNGARCICRYGYENGLSGEAQRIETISGIVTGERLGRDRYRVKLTPPTCLKTHIGLTVLGEEYDCDYVELGTPGLPHAVVYVNEEFFNREDLFNIGRELRYNPAFPKGANVNFCTVTGENRLRLRTFERGVEDFTLACGTGTASSVLACMNRGLVSGTDVMADMPGGTLSVTVCRGELYLTGPAVISYYGTLPELE